MKSFQFATIFGHGIVRYDVDYYMQALNNAVWSYTEIFVEISSNSLSFTTDAC